MITTAVRSLTSVKGEMSELLRRRAAMKLRKRPLSPHHNFEMWNLKLQSYTFNSPSPHKHKCASHDDNHSSTPTRAQNPRLVNLPPTTTTHASAIYATTCWAPHALEPQDDLRPEPQSHTNGRAEPGKLCVSLW